MTREEFETVLALEGQYFLQTKFIQGHRGNGRYRAALMYTPMPSNFVGTLAWQYAKTEEQAVAKLINWYINYPFA